VRLETAIPQLPSHATIIIPTHDHGLTLRYPLASLKQQTLSNFDAYIIGDGVPESLKPALRGLVAEDERFHFLDHPKHFRRGEPYRDGVLRGAADGIVCYLCDRDIWLPEHLEQMWELLQSADYSHSLPLHILPDGSYRAFPLDLSFAGYRSMMCTVNDNRIPFSCFAHRLDAYHRLPEGWATTPGDLWTDLHMFRKFFASESLKGVSGLSPSAATFPSPPRKDWSSEQRLAELRTWWDRLTSESGRAAFERATFKATIRAQREEAVRLSEHAQQIQQQLNLRQSTELWRKMV
jgi:glycosyltransferase involved in cell wall biosynthesis